MIQQFGERRHATAWLDVTVAPGFAPGDRLAVRA